MIITDFILQEYIPNLTICDELISYHESSELKKEGAYFRDGKRIVDKSYKDSIDVPIRAHDSEVCAQYIKDLMSVAEIYKKEFFFSSKKIGPWGIREAVNIQKYPPGGGFHQWHTERANGTSPAVNRHLVFMTYLNDVTDAGETEFFYQKIKIQPRKGLTVIWPVDWTYTHRGIASPTQTKYITTGWFSFLTN